MIFTVRANDPRPIYEQLAAQVRASALMGKLGPGDRLPAARDLAESLNIHHHTVLRAYQDLRDEGLIELRRGRGAIITVVASEPHADLTKKITELRTLAQELGIPIPVVAGLLMEGTS